MRKLMTVIAVGYPLGLTALAFFLMQQDPKLIFNQYYLLGTLVLLPAMLLSLVVVIARSDDAPKLSSVATLGLWVLIVTGLHLWFIGLMVRTL